MYRVGDKVRIVHEDGTSVNEMVDEIGIIVSFIQSNAVAGIDFGKEITPDTWDLEKALPSRTGRYYSIDNIELFNQWEVSLL